MRLGELSVVVNWIILVMIILLNVYFFAMWFKSLVQEFLKERKAAKALAEQKKAAKEKAARGEKDEELPELERINSKKEAKKKRNFAAYFSSNKPKKSYLKK